MPIKFNCFAVGLNRRGDFSFKACLALAGQEIYDHAMKILSVPEGVSSGYDLYDLEGERGVLAWVLASNPRAPVKLVERGELQFDRQLWLMAVIAQDKGTEPEVAWFLDDPSPAVSGALAPRSMGGELLICSGSPPRSWVQCLAWLQERSARRLSQQLASACQNSVALLDSKNYGRL